VWKRPYCFVCTDIYSEYVIRWITRSLEALQTEPYDSTGPKLIIIFLYDSKLNYTSNFAEGRTFSGKYCSVSDWPRLN